MTTGKTISLTRWTFVGKVMSQLFNMLSRLVMGFPGGSDGKASAYNAGDLGLIPGSGRSPGEGNGNTPVFMPGKSHGPKSLGGYSPWGHKDSDMTEQLHFHFHFQVGHNFSSKEEASFNFMAAVTIHSDFGAQKISLSLFPLSPHLFATK